MSEVTRDLIDQRKLILDGLAEVDKLLDLSQAQDAGEKIQFCGDGNDDDGEWIEMYCSFTSDSSKYRVAPNELFVNVYGDKDKGYQYFIHESLENADTYSNKHHFDREFLGTFKRIGT